MRGRLLSGAALGVILLVLGAGLSQASTAPGDWAMGGHDVSGNRDNSAGTSLTAANVRTLHQAWSFTTPGQVYGTPAVVGGVVYDADSLGNVYALDAASGTPKWVTSVGPATFVDFVTASPLVTDTLVVVGDLSGVVHALDRATGLQVWVARPNNNGTAAIYGPPSTANVMINPVTGLRKQVILVPVASNDETFTQTPEQPCCLARGSVAALDPATGAVLWQTYTVTDAQAQAGSSGASVWTMPIYDPESNLAYISTGNNFSEPATDTSDAMLALNAADGSIVWKHQLWPNDTWVFHYSDSAANPDHPDLDFADSPELFRLVNGTKVVAAGQKSGFLHVLDAATGAVVSQAQYLPSGGLGGFFADSAQAGGVVFANGNDWPDQIPIGGPPAKSGSVIAIRADRPGSQKELWRFTVPGGPMMGGIAYANGVVYFHASFEGVLHALDAATGAVLASVPLGPAVNGPSVVGNRVYVGIGDNGTVGQTTNGAIVSLGP